MYHVAHGFALAEYLATVWFKPEAKGFPYVSLAGMLPFATCRKTSHHKLSRHGPRCVWTSTAISSHDTRSNELLARRCLQET